MGKSIGGNTINKEMKRTNGNKAEKVVTLSNYNMQNRHLQNKITDVRNFLGENKPHILGISEAELNEGVDQLLIQVEGYELLTLKALQNH